MFTIQKGASGIKRKLSKSINVLPLKSGGIIEFFEAGDPVIGQNQSQDFSYTAGQRYFVMCNGEFGTITNGWISYRAFW